jgi:hypothetical protein
MKSARRAFESFDWRFSAPISGSVLSLTHGSPFVVSF